MRGRDGSISMIAHKVTVMKQWTSWGSVSELGVYSDKPRTLETLLTSCLLNTYLLTVEASITKTGTVKNIYTESL